MKIPEKKTHFWSDSLLAPASSSHCSALGFPRSPRHGLPRSRPPRGHVAHGPWPPAAGMLRGFCGLDLNVLECLEWFGMG